jgi:hypothetical protein
MGENFVDGQSSRTERISLGLKREQDRRILLAMKKMGERLLSQRPISSVSYETWFYETLEFIKTAFGSDTTHLEAFSGGYSTAGDEPNEISDDAHGECMRAIHLAEKIAVLSLLIDQIEIPKIGSPKDPWDKATIIAQYISGVLLALVGLVVSWAINSGQEGAARQTAASNYLLEIVKQNNADKRGELLRALDLTSFPEEAVPMALRYAVSARKGWSADPRPVFDGAIDALTKLKKSPEAVKALKQAAQATSDVPSSEIAASLLGGPPCVLVRIWQIDDFGVLKINDKEVLNLIFAQDSGWKDVTKLLHTGYNRFNFVVRNGWNTGENDWLGSFSGQIEISAGVHQYDSGFVIFGAPNIGYPKLSPKNQAFYIVGGIMVGADGQVTSMGSQDAIPYNIDPPVPTPVSPISK